MRWTSILILCGVLVGPALVAQSSRIPAGDWPMYNRDLGGMRYSPLAQVNTGNVGKLSQAWSYRLREEAGGEATSEVTPIVVRGTMYLPAANRIVALAAETGREVWRYELPSGTPSRRGVAYWPGDQSRPARILFTSGRRLIALHAGSGKLDPGFGREGEVDLVVPYFSVPTIYKDVVLVGANPGGAPLGPPGDTRAYDARTGQKLWEFHSVARPGEPGHETWGGDSWKGRSATNVWAFYMTVDQERGIVYMPFASPSAYFYGGDRPGANLFGNSVVAVDAATGKYRWHFQTIHHDLWDADPPAGPGLLEIVRNGRKIPALAQITKSGFMYILDRLTGEPVFGVEERPVPQSEVPGEHSWPTQPFPVKPPPLARLGFKLEDLVTAADTTPEHARACRDLVEKSGGVYNAGPFTPWLFRAEGAPPRSTLNFPGGLGGGNWGGTALDPNLNYIFVNTQDNGALGWLEKAKEGSPVPYEKTSVTGSGPGRGNFEVPITNSSGRAIPGGNWPCQKPPWARLIAVNANTGDFAWQTPLGITEQLPEGKRNTGRTGLGGPIVTAGGLVFIGAANDRLFRAFNARTGKELWAVRLASSANATPITYQGGNSKQYVAVVAGQELTVFTLP